MGILTRIGSPILKAVNRQVGIRGAEPRKGNFQWMAGLPSKKVLKPVLINNVTLKQLANTDPITWAIKATRKTQVTQTKWDIVRDTEQVELELDRWYKTIINSLNPWGFEETFHPLLINRDLYLKCFEDIKKIVSVEGVDKNATKSQLKWYFESVKRKLQADADSHAHIVRKIFERPNDSECRTFRQFLELLVDDILTYDAGVIVKNANSLGELAEMYILPGQDIKLYRNPDRTMPKVPEYAFVWEDNGTLRAEYTSEEIIYIMANPQQNGYGMSPIEVAAYIITASLFADEYNIDFFKHSNVPPAIMSMGKNITQEQRTSFQSQWDNEVSGKGLHRMMFLAGAEDPKLMPIQNLTNRDMQMMEYLKWTLSVKCACFQISPQDISFIQDFHRTTAETQKEISKSRGIMNLLSLLETNFNEEIVKKCFPFKDVKFQWQGIDLNDDALQSQIDIADINNGVISRNDRRKRLGMVPVEGGDTILVNAQPGAVRIEDLVPPEEEQEQEQPMTAEIQGQGQVPPPEQGSQPPQQGNMPPPQQAPGEEMPSEVLPEQILRMSVNSFVDDTLAKAMRAMKKEGLGDNEVRIQLEK